MLTMCFFLDRSVKTEMFVESKKTNIGSIRLPACETAQRYTAMSTEQQLILLGWRCESLLFSLLFPFYPFGSLWGPQHRTCLLSLRELHHCQVTSSQKTNPSCQNHPPPRIHYRHTWAGAHLLLQLQANTPGLKSTLTALIKMQEVEVVKAAWL